MRGSGSWMSTSSDFLEHALEEALVDGDDVILLNEGHLKVDLGELRLTVGTQVLVAEAAGDLDVTVHAGAA